MRYAYSASARSGKRITGEIEAADRVGAIRLIEKLGHVPVSLSPLPDRPSKRVETGSGAGEGAAGSGFRPVKPVTAALEGVPECVNVSALIRFVRQAGQLVWFIVRIFDFEFFFGDTWLKHAGQRFPSILARPIKWCVSMYGGKPQRSWSLTTVERLSGFFCGLERAVCSFLFIVVVLTVAMRNHENIKTYSLAQGIAFLFCLRLLVTLHQGMTKAIGNMAHLTEQLEQRLAARASQGVGKLTYLVYRRLTATALLIWAGLMVIMGVWLRADDLIFISIAGGAGVVLLSGLIRKRGVWRGICAFMCGGAYGVFIGAASGLFFCVVLALLTKAVQKQQQPMFDKYVSVCLIIFIVSAVILNAARGLHWGLMGTSRGLSRVLGAVCMLLWRAMLSFLRWLVWGAQRIRVNNRRRWLRFGLELVGAGVTAWVFARVLVKADQIRAGEDSLRLFLTATGTYGSLVGLLLLGGMFFEGVTREKGWRVAFTVVWCLLGVLAFLSVLGYVFDVLDDSYRNFGQSFGGTVSACMLCGFVGWLWRLAREPGVQDGPEVGADSSVRSKVVRGGGQMGSGNWGK